MLRWACFSIDSLPQCTSKVCSGAAHWLRTGAGSSSGVELFEVDAEWHRQDVGSVDAVELLAGERGGAHDRVVVASRAPVCGIGDDAGESLRKDLSDKAIQALVGDHHRRHGPSASPRTQRPQREPVGHFEGIRIELLE